MSLNSKAPGVCLGWLTPGKNGTRRLKKTSKKFARRLARRAASKERLGPHD